MGERKGLLCSVWPSKLLRGNLNLELRTGRFRNRKLQLPRPLVGSPGGS